MSNRLDTSDDSSSSYGQCLHQVQVEATLQHPLPRIQQLPQLMADTSSIDAELCRQLLGRGAASQLGMPYGRQ